MQEEAEGPKGLTVRKALSELESSVQILVITHLGPNGSEKQKRTMEKELLKRKKETLRSESNYLCPTMDVVPVTGRKGSLFAF